MSDDISKILQAQAKTHTLLESHVKLSDERHLELKKDLVDHETRIRNGETWRARAMGWAIGAGVISGATVDAIKSKIGF